MTAIVMAMLLSAEPSSAQQDVVRAVVNRIESVGRKSVPDSGLLPSIGPLPLLSRLGRDGPMVTVKVDASRWTVKPLSAWRADADARKRPVYAVMIGLPEIDGDVALVSVGVELIRPSDFAGVVMCCCTATDTYRRGADGVWRFSRRGGTVCA